MVALECLYGIGETVEDMINFDKGVQSSLIPKPLSTQDKNKFIRNGVEMVKKHHAIPQKKEGKLADKSPDSKSSASSLDPVQKIYTIQQNEQWRDIKTRRQRFTSNFLLKITQTSPQRSFVQLDGLSMHSKVPRSSKRRLPASLSFMASTERKK